MHFRSYRENEWKCFMLYGLRILEQNASNNPRLGKFGEWMDGCINKATIKCKRR